MARTRDDPVGLDGKVAIVDGGATLVGPGRAPD
jgi:hypothetical protein